LKVFGLIGQLTPIVRQAGLKAMEGIGSSAITTNADLKALPHPIIKDLHEH